jgi:predicted nucleic acid-binding protein
MLISELTRALGYRRLERYINPQQVVHLVDAIARAALPVPDPDEVPKISRDPEDDYLFAVARAWANV